MKGHEGDETLLHRESRDMCFGISASRRAVGSLRWALDCEICEMLNLFLHVDAPSRSFVSAPFTAPKCLYRLCI